MMLRLTMDKYQELAMRTSPEDGHDKRDNGALGLIGETGEIVDIYKKWQYQSGLDAKIPTEQFAEEIGDVLWYLAELADGLGYKMSDIAKTSFESLDRRMRRPGRTAIKVRRIVVGVSGRANRLRMALDTGELTSVGIQYRKILLGAAQLAWITGYRLEEIAAMNIKKLKRRYPDGFDAKISTGRYE